MPRTGQAYGSPRIHAELVDDHDETIGVNRVARLVAAAGIEGISGRKRGPRTTIPTDRPKPPDLVRRDFSATAPNTLWLADITYLPTDEGWLYLAIILVNTGWFALYTYVAPFWIEVSGVSAATVPTALLAYGIFSAIGGAAGGKLANGHATTTMLGSVAAQAILLGAMMFSTTAMVSLVIAMLWGFAAWVFVTAVQVRVVALARAQSDVASSVAVSAFNVGNAAGALAGGAVVAHYGLVAAPAAAAGFVLAGLVIALFSGRRSTAA